MPKRKKKARMMFERFWRHRLPKAYTAKRNEPKEDVIAKICIICCRRAGVRKPAWQKKVKFLLEQVVPYSPIPESQFHHEEVEDRIYFCTSCHNYLAEGLRTRAKIINLEKSLEKLKRDVKVMVDGSILIKTEDDDKEEFDLYVNIREQLLTDFVREEEEQTNDEDKLADDLTSEWSGLDFGGYHEDDEMEEDKDHILAFSGEVGADPLELDLIAQQEKAGISLENLDISQSTRDLLLEDNRNLQAFHELNEGRVVTTYSKTVPKRNVSQVNAQLDAMILPELRDRQRQKKGMWLYKKLPKVAAPGPDQILETMGGGNMNPRSKSIPESTLSSSKTGIFPSAKIWKVLKAGRDSNDNLPRFTDLDVRWIHKDHPITPSTRKGLYPCIICPDILTSATYAQLHRKFMHPGLAVCVSPILSLQCGKIFKSKDICRHRKESHPLLRCPDCLESFSSEKGRDLHLKKVHYPDSSPPTLPDCGYDVKLIPWVNPLSEEEVKVVTRDQRSLCLEIERVKTKIDDHAIRTDSDKAPQNVAAGTGAQTGNQTKDAMSTSLVSADDTDKNLGHTKSSSTNHQDEGLKSNNSNLPPTICVNTKSTTSTSNVIDNKMNTTDTTHTASNPSPPHLAKVKPKKPKKILYNCGICSTKFPVQSDLLQHLQDAHNQKMKFGCFICHQEFASLTECEAHVFQKHPGSSATTTSPVEKISYPQPLPQPPNGREHKNMPNAWPFSCIPCLMRFSTLAVLKAHLKSKDHSLTIQHGPVRVCPRKGCTHKYREVENLTSHIATDHPEPEPQCPERNCKRKFDDAETLIRHRVRCHKYIPADPLPPLIFACKIENCERTFSKKDYLAKHMIFFHNVGVKFNCTQCGKRFMTERRLTDHVKYLHDKVPGPYTCGTCGKHFMTRGKLNYHTAIHLEDRPFLCSECGKAFKTRVSLTIHNYGHDPDRYTKHYPYRIQIQKRLETQKRKEAAKMTDNMASNSRSSKKGRKRSNSHQMDQSSTDPPVTISLPMSIDQQQFPVPESVVHFNDFMEL